MRWHRVGFRPWAALYFLSAFALSTDPGIAQNKTYYQDGNDLHKACEQGGSGKFFAMAYTEGVVDGRQYEIDGYCIPLEVQAQQLVDVVCRSLASNPQDRHHLAHKLVAQALRDAWPCQ